MNYIGYHIVYQEKDRDFRRTGVSNLLKQIASFSSNYFILNSSLENEMYKIMYDSAKIDRNREEIKNFQFVYDQSYNLMHTYLTILPYKVDETTQIILKLIDDYPSELYKLSNDICSVELQLLSTK